MKTTTHYSAEIKEKYKTDLLGNTLKSNLYKLSPGNVQKALIHLIDQGLSESDLKSLTNFFELNEVDNLRKHIKNYDIDGFRPICKFLSGKTESVQSYDLLELISILIDYQPRPYKKFKSFDTQKTPQEESIIKSENFTNQNESGYKVKVSIDNSEEKSSGLGGNKLNRKVIIIICSIVLISLLVIIPTNQQRWMVWNVDHYKEVFFNLKEYDISELKLYKAEWVRDFKQIVPHCGVTKFFKDDGSPNLWYGKSPEGSLEYFTHYGLHPKTGKTLKPITDYMIGKHICE